MKLFYEFLLLICLVFCFNSASCVSRSEYESQKKLEQLKSLLAQTSNQGNIADVPLSDDINKQEGQQKEPDAILDEPPPYAENAYDQAFSGVINNLLPMSTDQIAKLREVFNETQKAVSIPAGVPPKSVSTSLLVNLTPNASPPVIRLGAGYITSLVFVDSTGQPWPIAAYSVGDPSAFNIQWDRKSNTLLIQSMTFYKRSNLAVILRDLNTPIMITLLSGQEAVDYRVDLRVPGIGPNAVYIQNGIPDSVNPILFDVLNGIPPKGSKELKTSTIDCKAWLLGGKVYLRTNLNITSPGWQAIMSSVDGTHAYQLQPTPVLLALKNGKDKIITVILEGLE